MIPDTLKGTKKINFDLINYFQILIFLDIWMFPRITHKDTLPVQCLVTSINFQTSKSIIFNF